MAFNLKNRSFLKEIDFEPRELQYLLELSAALKQAKFAGNEVKRLKGKEIALIFEKTSTRTRSAFEVAPFDQGASLTSTRRVPNSATRSPSPTLRACWVGCATASSSRRRLADRRAMELHTFARYHRRRARHLLGPVRVLRRNTGHSFWSVGAVPDGRRCAPPASPSRHGGPHDRPVLYRRR
jgi:hypothetical protein